MTQKLSRRDFLRLTATGLGALTVSEILAACGVDELPATPSAVPTDAPTADPTATSTPQPPTATLEEIATTEVEPTATKEPTATATDIPTPDLVVVRNGEPEQLVRQAIAALGGMEKFVPKGADVIVKPNICVDFREYAWGATTNPWVVGALVKMCFEAGAARVRVMDQTWKRNMTQAYLTSGIQEQVEAAGGEMEWMPLDKFVATDVPLGIDLKSFDIYDEVLNTDVLINVPVAKHHMDAKLTLAMKNLMGIIGDRPVIHDNFGQRIADLASAIRPTLNVMDAVRVMKKNGPIGFFQRDTHQMDTVIASADIVAIDAYTTRLFDLTPADLDYVVCAANMGLGHMDLENLRIEEFNVT
ncbi:MAG TPA: hypothetical protein DEH25_12775 [Chloroflexi bacterium]|nr:hypothetical protein [Chloroflexota bacterium]